MQRKSVMPASLILVLGLSMLPTGAACGVGASRQALEETPPPRDDPAQIVRVETRRNPNEEAVTFVVTVRSPDTGCDRYADWWEVITPQGELLYRRILTHSHVDEQPFTRSGGPVALEADREVLVRVHVHPDGYVRRGARGTLRGGFEPEVLEEVVDALARQEPLPDGCRF